MHREVEHTARMREKRDAVEDGGNDRPETIGDHCEQECRAGAEEVNGEMSSVEIDICHRRDAVEQEIETDHRCRNPCHRALGTTAAAQRIDGGNQEKEGEGCGAHHPSLP